RLLREPATTVTAVALNLRPDHPELGDAKTRKALLEAVDRARILTVVYGGLASSANGLIPPTSWAYDPDASPATPHDVKAAAKLLTEAGWTKKSDGWHRGKAGDPTKLELIVPSHESSPILAAVGAQVAADWTRLGF